MHPGGIGLGSLGELVKGDAPDGMAAPSRGDQAAIGEDSEEDINVAAVSAYRASIDTGEPLSERKLTAMFGKISRR